MTDKNNWYLFWPWLLNYMQHLIIQTGLCQGPNHGTGVTNLFLVSILKVSRPPPGQGGPVSKKENNKNEMNWIK